MSVRLQDVPLGLSEADYEPELVFAFSARMVREGARRRNGSKVEPDPDGGACVWASTKDAEAAMRFYVPESGVFSLSLEEAKWLAASSGRRSLVLVDEECYEVRRWEV